MLKYIFAAIITTLLFVVNILRDKLSKDTLFILRTVFIILLLEVTIFNINSYRTDFGNLEYMQLVKDEISEITNYTTDNTQYVSIENIDKKVKSVYIELDNLEKNQIVEYDLYYSDRSTSNRYLASKSYFQDVEKTKYSTISLSRRLQKYFY